MNIQQFKYVVTIAQTKSFSKAAEILYISQPALSQYIKRLENEIGVDLFTRDKTNVNITEAGETFVEEAIKILELYENLLNKMITYSNIYSDTLTIGVSQFYGKYYIPKILPKINNKFPNMSIRINESESKILEEYILNNKIDLALIPLPIQSPNIKYDLISNEKILFAINSENQKLKSMNVNNLNTEIDFSIFKDEPFALLKKGLKLRDLAESICSEYGFKPNVVFEAENLDTLNSIVSNNIAVSFLPEIINRYDNIKYLEFKSKFSKRPIVIAYKRDKHGHSLMSSIINIALELNWFLRLYV